ncbi:conserved hypothetical protein [Deferribacter desulfuricans SSM1]|uniref:Uncharacterized protein n=1 Tax=Deferribacter desulfuricans (strain DSM 14783 / JCM 11476 / NBRC 101012 / SSM1) TaxID=639282 RepID=D3PD80_DEFDS|nr:recombination protein O N-terminal domain-containing protein [Deferribacter desulfuricans]BAI80553.1 conserved hypothetical protein [Deferribacter desulfuricans SSM1]
MSRVKTEAIIYKLINYADKSAIGYVFSKDYGLIKVFISSAFSKKGGVFKFLPGIMELKYKENGLLHKYYGFEQNVSYNYFLDNPYILMRLNLLFFLIDEYGIENNEYVWKLILNIREENIYKSFVYITYYILKGSGVFPEIQCLECGAKSNLYLCSDLAVRCGKCTDDKKYYITNELFKIFSKLNNKEKYKIFVVDKKVESNYINFIRHFVETDLNKKIKLFDMLYI